MADMLDSGQETPAFEPRAGSLCCAFKQETVPPFTKDYSSQLASISSKKEIKFSVGS